MYTFTTEFGRVEVKPISEEYPRGYAYFHGQDYETELEKGRFLGEHNFRDMYGTTFVVLFPCLGDKSATLSVIRQQVIAKGE